MSRIDYHPAYWPTYQAAFQALLAADLTNGPDRRRKSNADIALEAQDIATEAADFLRGDDLAAPG